MWAQNLFFFFLIYVRYMIFDLSIRSHDTFFATLLRCFVFCIEPKPKNLIENLCIKKLIIDLLACWHVGMLACHWHIVWPKNSASSGWNGKHSERIGASPSWSRELLPKRNYEASSVHCSTCSTQRPPRRAGKSKRNGRLSAHPAKLHRCAGSAMTEPSGPLSPRRRRKLARSLFAVRSLFMSCAAHLSRY